MVEMFDEFVKKGRFVKTGEEWHTSGLGGMKFYAPCEVVD